MFAETLFLVHISYTLFLVHISFRILNIGKGEFLKPKNPFNVVYSGNF